MINGNWHSLFTLGKIIRSQKLENVSLQYGDHSNLYVQEWESNVVKNPLVFQEQLEIYIFIPIENNAIMFI